MGAIFLRKLLSIFTVKINFYSTIKKLKYIYNTDYSFTLIYKKTLQHEI